MGYRGILLLACFFAGSASAFSGGAPTVWKVTPNVAAVGGSQFTITVIGSQFDLTTQVLWNGAALASHYAGRELRAVVPASYITAAGTASITVTNGTSVSPAVTFTISNPPSRVKTPPIKQFLLPVLTNVSPSSFARLQNGGVLTVTGQHFASSAVVYWGTEPLVTSYVSATSLRATVPASFLTGPVTSAIPITVTNSAPAGDTSGSFMVSLVNPKPVVNSVTPSQFSVYRQDTTIQLAGSNFVPGVMVYWNGAALSTQYVSQYSVTAAAPASLFAEQSSPTVTAVNPTPGGGASNGVQVSVVCAIPQLFTPSLSFTDEATDVSFQVSVVGDIPAADLSVSWNGAPLAVQSVTPFTGITVVSAIVPAADIEAGGTAQVTVTDGCGTSSPISADITIPTPMLSSASPDAAFGVVGGAGVTVTLTGGNFLPGARVSFDDSPRATTYVSASQVTVALTAADVAAVGSHVLTAINSGTGASESAAYYYTVGYTVDRLNQYAYDITWDEADQVLYASAAYWAQTNTNTLMTIDPVSGQITATVATSATPDILAISDDDSYLYVGFGQTNNVDSNIAPVIKRYSLPGLVPDISWTVGKAANFAMAIAVKPGAAHTVAVIRAQSGDALVYDDGVVRTDSAGQILYDFASPTSSLLAWNSAGTSLYTADFEYADSLFEFGVGSSGVTFTQKFSEQPPPFSITGTHYDALTGHLFLDDGFVIDPTTGVVVTALTLPGSSQTAEGVVVDDATGMVYVAYAGGSPTVPGISVVSYDLATLNPQDTAFIVTYYPDADTRLLRWGSHGLALLEGFGTIDILQGDFVK